MSMNTHDTMVDQISRTLKARKISQADFCRTVNTSTKHLNRVLMGHDLTRTATLDRWAEALGLRFEVILVPLEEA
jgi:transcriptional regulator with XRE-family HTH domain